MSMSNFLENKSLDHNLGVAEFVYVAGGRYLALYTADPTDADITANEVNTTTEDTAYARQPISFAAAVAGSSTSSNTQTFPAVIYGTDGVAYDVTHYAIMDAITGGNQLHHAALTSAITRIATKTLIIDTGNLTVNQT